MIDLQASEEIVPSVTKEQAAEIRKAMPPFDVWRVVRWQAMALVAFSAGVSIFSHQLVVVGSFAWGGLCALIPSAMFARGISFQMKRATHAGLALLSMAKWELIKVASTVLMLLISPKVLLGLDWLALFVGFVVTMKVHWVACYWVVKSSRVMHINNGN